MELLFLGCQGVTWIVLEVGLHPDYHCTKQEEPIDTTVDFLMIKNHVFFLLGVI